MKKYFVVETDEICEFGDALHLVMFKELEDGKVTVEKDVEFNEDTMDWMIEMGFVQEREVEENNLIDFGEEPCDALAALEEDFEVLEERLDKLEEFTKGIYEELKKLVELQIKEEKKTAKSQKK